MNATQLERAKYQRMWTEVAGYRSSSPGERLVDRFTKTAKGLKMGDTIIDLGCGTGRASAILEVRGFNVWQLDITETSRDPDVRAINLPFVEACLWELPEALPKFDWLYCCDVLEHLPTNKVDKALDCMKAITGKGAFMQIALFAEAFGRHIGDTLHLTVQPAEWWEEKILERWHCEAFTIDQERLVFCTGAAR